MEITKITKEIKEAIVNEMASELSNRSYNYETVHLKTIVNTCLERKSNLIDLLSKHPNWNPNKLMIQFDTDIERKIDINEVLNFAYWLKEILNIEWCWYGNETREYKIYDFIRCITQQFFDESMREQIDKVNELNPNFKLRTNMKSSKAIGKICREEGWDKLDGYNQKYAALCDALSPLKITRHTVISVNPIDYLLMSNGNSWSSCHDIGYMDDDEPGCYSAGTISYMLDEHSFLFYTVDASYNGNKIELEPKIQRQMFGYNDDVIVQLRLYPQDNDKGAEQVYTDIRAIVQKVVSDCLGKPNLWVKSTKNIEEIVRLGDGAVCYPDWHRHNPGSTHCSVSTLKDRESNEIRKIVFGAEPICITCGNRHDYENCISCCDAYGGYEVCDICGHRIHRDNVYWGGYWEDTPYCEDCCTYCEDCDRYYPNDECQEIDGNYVCEHCIDNGDYYTCEECGSIHHSDNMVYVDECYFCEDCVDECTFVCDECNERFLNKDRYYDEDSGCDYCSECYEELKEREIEEVYAF